MGDLGSSCRTFSSARRASPEQFRQRFGYLVEGPAVTDLLAGYWTPVWQYSSPHKVT